MKNSKKYLAIDLGASSGRIVAGIFSGPKLVLEEIHRFPNQAVQVPSGMHWDVLRLFFEIKKGLALFVKKYGADLDGIGIDTWGVDFVLLDRNGHLLGNPYHYRDKRTEGIAEEIGSLIDRYQIYTTTGTQLAPINTICQLYSLVKNDSPQLEIADFFLMMPGIFNYFLTGEKVEEYTIITPTSLYDIKSESIATLFFEKLNIPTRIMPQIVKPGTIIGHLLPEVGKEVGLGRVPVIAPACHDTASAAAAVPVLGEENWAFLSSGTWSVLGVEAPEPITTRQSCELNLTNAGAVCGKFITVANITGLWIIEQCKKTWEREGKALDYQQMIMLAEKAKPFAAFIDPDDKAFANPPDMPAAITKYCENTGQREPKDKGIMIRVVLKSLALKYKKMLEKVETLRGEVVKILYIVGGGIQNQLLNQLTANATGKRVVTGPVEATAIGNIIMQAIATGHLKSIEEARKMIRYSFEIKTYYPENREDWDKARMPNA